MLQGFQFSACNPLEVVSSSALVGGAVLSKLFTSELLHLSWQ